jgi:muramoyltetrapeptide carboxypeptidase
VAAEFTALRPVKSGARARIIAPSGPVPMERFERGLRVFRRTLQLDCILPNNLLEQDGYLAGTDAVRLANLHAALEDDEAAMLIAARGGYGAMRLLSALDHERLRLRPKILVGFSDITALLCWAYVRCGLPAVHGPVITQCGTLGEPDLDQLATLVHGEIPTPLTAEEGTVVCGGTVEGPLFAGNIEVLRSLIGTRYMPDFNGAILGLEEVGEVPYRIDRALTQLILSGSLRGLRGIVVGDLHNCDPEGSVGPTALEVVVERCKVLGVPVATGFGFGHNPYRNAALPFGRRVRLHADDCTLQYLEPLTG